MTQEDRRFFLIRALLDERIEYRGIAVPEDEQSQKKLLRSLLNVRPAVEISPAFLSVQDIYLSEELKRKGITDAASLTPIEGKLCLWQGDITTLRIDAIVNAANAQMTGCYVPCHSCIDNCIHTFSGVQLRAECDRQMRAQGHEEPTGSAKITPGYNLPCRYILHTVGPIVQGRLTEQHRAELASCYRACLRLAEENGAKSIAFCCISTGVFGFPQQAAAEIAVGAVREYLNNSSIGQVVFNVFKDEDYAIYQKLLKGE